jgi:hypothetical protein
MPRLSWPTGSGTATDEPPTTLDRFRLMDWRCADRVVGSAAGNVWVLGVGEEDLERGAPARALLDPGAAGVEAGELGDQGQAEPEQGARRLVSVHQPAPDRTVAV